MGNLVSYSSKSWLGAGGKLVFSDGSIRSLTEPTTVAELMLSHPNHYVIDSQFVPAKGTKLSPLPADHMLDLSKVYLLLPATRGKKLSAEEARRVLASAKPTKRLTRSCSAPISPVVAEMETSVDFTIAGILEDHRPEFMSVSRQLSCKGWKPSLGTIVESTGSSRKVPHWLF